MKNQGQIKDLPPEEMDDLLDIINDIKEQYDLNNDFGIKTDDGKWKICYYTETRDCFFMKTENEKEVKLYRLKI